MKSFLEFIAEDKNSYFSKLEELSYRVSSGSYSDKIILTKIIKSVENELDHTTYNKLSSLPYSKRIKIKISELYATQRDVDIKSVKNIIENFNIRKTNIVVALYNKKHVILDGHHTIAAMYIMGYDKIEVTLRYDQ